METKTSPHTSTNKAWFDNLIAMLRVDQLQLETRTADDKKTQFYNNLIVGNPLKIAADVKSSIQETIVPQIIIEFIDNLKGNMPRKLAVDYNDSKVLFWAELNDDDERTEDQLIMSEAKVNAKFIDAGYCVSSTILEASDNVKIPAHYQTIVE